LASVFDLEFRRHAKEGVWSAVAEVGWAFCGAGHGLLHDGRIGTLGYEADDAGGDPPRRGPRGAFGLGVETTLTGHRDQDTSVRL